MYSHVTSPNCGRVRNSSFERVRSNSYGSSGGNDRPKILSLKNLKDFIGEVFDCKFRHDQRCQELGAPLETMEQFLYTHLSKKYGLKSLILQQAATVINSVR